MDSIAKYEVQILFTEIERDKNNLPVFRDYGFQVDENNYFYPASTVKFPVAVLALEKIQQTENLDINSNFYVEGDTVISTFGQEIVKIFAVSDNDANNRLFEFLGQDYIDKTLEEKGIKARISHRLSTEDSDDIVTRPLIFYINDSTTVATEKIISRSLRPLQLKNIQKGKGFMEDGQPINDPMDFSYKNYFPLRSQHQMMKQLIFPKSFPTEKQFALSGQNREFLLNAMKTLPKDAGYDPNEYYDSYGKFLIFGDSRSNIPKHVKIYNKVGYAYGTLTDCAYIKNEKTGREYIISATILVNQNGIFNDNNYEYDTVGIPFLAALGQKLTGIEPTE